MATDIGAVLALDGVSQFRQSMQVSAQVTKQFNEQLKGIASTFGATGASEDQLASKNKVLANSIQNSKNTMAVLSGELTKQTAELDRLEQAMNNANSEYGENSAEAQKAQSAYARQQVAVSKLETQYSKAESQVEQMTAEMKQNDATIDNIKRGYDEAGREVDEFGNSVDNSGGKFKVGIKNIAVGIGVFKALEAGLSAIKNSIGGAVSRVDTLNQFPKIMQNFGYSAEDSSAAIDKLSDGIDGLPTALDDVASTAQSLGTLTGDLDLATDLTLALNNAFLASGSDSEAASRGMQQYTQMLSSGKVDMQSWKTLQETMGTALSQTAQELLGAEASTNDLYAALQSGQISFDEFNTAMIKMSEEGGAGFDSFADQALTASAGIATSAQNIKTALTKNIANVIDTIDTQMQEAGFGGIVDKLNGVKDGVNKAFEGIISGIKAATTGLSSDKSFSENLTSILKNIGTMMVRWVTSNLPMIVTNGARMLTALIQGIADSVPQLIPAIVTVVMTLVNTLINNLPVLIEAALKLGLALLRGLIDALPQIIAALPKIINSIINFLVNNIEPIIQAGIQLFMALIKAIPVIVKAILPQIPKIIVAIVKGLISGFGQILKAGAQLGVKLWSGISSKVSWIKNNILSFAKSIPGKIKEGVGNLFSIGTNLIAGLWNGLKSKFTDITNKVKGLAGGILGTLKKVFGINSPATTTTWMGEMLDFGLIKGLESVQGQVAKAARKVSEVALDGLNTYGVSDVALGTGRIDGTITNTTNTAQQIVSGVVSGVATLLSNTNNTSGDIVINLDGKVIARSTVDNIPSIMKQAGVVTIG